MSLYVGGHRSDGALFFSYQSCLLMNADLIPGEVYDQEAAGEVKEAQIHRK